MGLRLGPLTLPWPKSAPPDDPYWEFFLRESAADPRNVMSEIIRRAPDGAVFPSKTELHSPEITSRQIKELAQWLGAELVGIVNLENQGAELSQGYRFGIVCGVRAEVDPRQAAGIGGQVPVQNELFVTMILSAYIRELGFRATSSSEPAIDRLAVAAGLGRIDASGRVVVPKMGTGVYLDDLIRTDLPLLADG